MEGAIGGPFDAEAFKNCKNTIKRINLCALPCLGLGLWLTLTFNFDLAIEVWEGGEVENFTFQSVQLFFRIRGF